MNKPIMQSNKTLIDNTTGTNPKKSLTNKRKNIVCTIQYAKEA
jgi:hypothetical protein